MHWGPKLHILNSLQLACVQLIWIYSLLKCQVRLEQLTMHYTCFFFFFCTKTQKMFWTYFNYPGRNFYEYLKANYLTQEFRRMHCPACQRFVTKTRQKFTTPEKQRICLASASCRRDKNSSALRLQSRANDMYVSVSLNHLGLVVQN